MKKEYLIFLIFLILGIIARFVTFNELSWFFGDNLHVDEITYVTGDSPPFERPPATYLLAGFSSNTRFLRFIFSLISLIPAIAFFLFREKSRNNSILAGILAIEPTLAFAGLQVLPAAPAAALVAIALTAGKNRPVFMGWALGCAALFRGELLLFLPVSLFFIRPWRKYVFTTSGFLFAILPVMFINLFSGGQFAVGENGPLNLWIGSTWELLETPPGLEFEELMGHDSFTDKALDSIKSDFGGWWQRGMVKSAVFLSIPGPGRNIEAPELLGSTVLKYLLLLTFLILVFGISGIGQNPATALFLTGVFSAFIFFPSMRHRVLYIPVLVLLIPQFRWKIIIPTTILIVFISFFFEYPARVRPGLTQVQMAQNYLESSDFDEALISLRKAEENGYYGADLHSVRGACIASSGGDFTEAVTEFAKAIELVPESPTVWKNMAALLWNYGYREDAVFAAEKAVSLNPGLRIELSPILNPIVQ